MLAVFLARPEGFEPPISKFVALHSIQLNYERIYNTFILYDVFLVFSRELWKIFKILMSLINERKTLSF